MKKFTWLLGVIALLSASVVNAQTVALGEPATFRAKSTTAQSYEWTFPGNVVINGEVVEFTFYEAGPFDVKLKVTGFDGNTNEITKRVLVANQGRPTAVIDARVDGQPVLSSRIEANLSQTINLSSASFYEDQGSEGLREIWTVNGRGYGPSEVNDAFNAIGNYQVSLTAELSGNPTLKDQDSLQVQIINQAPEVSQLSAQLLAGTVAQVQLQATAKDEDGTIGSYKFEALEGGRLVLAQAVSTSNTIMDLSRFAGEHEYDFRVTVTDDRFATATATTTQSLKMNPADSNRAPTVKINVVPGNQSQVGERYSFSAEASDPDNDNLKFEWILSTGQRFFTPAFETVFSEAGTVEVQLNVTDGLALVSDTMTLTVREVEAELIENQAPSARISGVLPGQKGSNSTVFRLYLEATDPDLDRLTYTWDFGNGTQSFTKNAAILYQEPGSYAVTVTVSDGLEQVTDSLSLTVALGPDDEPYESLEDRLVRLQEEQIEAEQLALEAQGLLNQEQEGWVQRMDDRVKAVVMELEERQSELSTQIEGLEASVDTTAWVEQNNQRLADQRLAGLEKAEENQVNWSDALARQQVQAEEAIRARKEKATTTFAALAADAIASQGTLTDEQVEIMDRMEARVAAMDEDVKERQGLVEELIADLELEKDVVEWEKENLERLKQLRQAGLEQATANQASWTETMKAQNKAAQVELDSRIETLSREIQTREDLILEKEGLLNSEQLERIAAMDERLAEAQAAVAVRNQEIQVATAEINRALGEQETVAQAMERLAAEQAETKTKYLALQQQGREAEAQKLERRLRELDTTMTEFEVARANQETLPQLAERLALETEATKADSEAYNALARAQQAEAMLERRDFLATQIGELQTLRSQPNPLPPLGISGQGQETLEERLERLGNQAERAALEAGARQRIAADLAAAQQAAYLEELETLQTQLAAEQDAQKQAVLAQRVETAEGEIERLEQVINPGEILSASEIQARTQALVAEVEAQQTQVVKEQQEYLAMRLAEIDNQIDLARDEGERSALEAEKKRLEANLDKTELVIDYPTQLEASQKVLNQRLAGNLNSTTELLVRTQLDSIEAKLQSLEKLQSAQQTARDFATQTGQDPAKAATAFLVQEKARLEAELASVQNLMAASQDPITQKALAQEEEELKLALARLPESPVATAGVEALLVREALDYLAHYRDAQSRLEATAGPSVVPVVEDHLALLRRLDNSGYTPQTKLSALLIDLERRENQLLADYRAATDSGNKEALKTKLVVLGEARDQLGALERYGVKLNDTVYAASRQLEQARVAANQTFLTAADGSQKAVATQELNRLANRQRWLQRFYNPVRRQTTLGDLEAELSANAKLPGADQVVRDLQAFETVKVTLEKAIATRIQTDFENFKTNLKRQALQVNDPEEKAALEARIAELSYQDFVAGVGVESADLFASLLADMTIAPGTNLFLYAETPLTQHDQPLLFEWALGDGETRFGQNVNHTYYEPGFYRVVLKTDDGVTSTQDLFTIRVTESAD